METAVEPVYETSDLPGERAPRPGMEAVIAHLDAQYRPRISGRRVIEAQPARYADMPPDLDPRLALALERRGIARLSGAHRRRAA